MPTRFPGTVPPAAKDGRTRRSTTGVGSGSDEAEVVASGAAVEDEEATARASGRASRPRRVRFVDGGADGDRDGGRGGGDRGGRGGGRGRGPRPRGFDSGNPVRRRP